MLKVPFPDVVCPAAEPNRTGLFFHYCLVFHPISYDSADFPGFIVPMD